MATIKSVLIHSLLLMIRGYRLIISGLLGPCCCRFEPSCSLYALEALRLHGVIKGCFLIVKRLLRCHPWHPGGIDNVPYTNKK